MTVELHRAASIRVPRSELIAAAAVQGLRGSIQIPKKKQLIDHFGSAEALCRADSETLKSMLPQRYWKHLPFPFPLEQAETAITRHDQLQVRTVLGYRPSTAAVCSRARAAADTAADKASDTAADNMADSKEDTAAESRAHTAADTAAEGSQQADSVPCTYTAALSHWSGAPLVWYEAGRCRTGRCSPDGGRGIGILTPESLSVYPQALDIPPSSSYPGSSYRAKAEEVLRWVYDQGYYSIHVLMHPVDTLLLKTAVEKGYYPLVILPHGIDTEQLQHLPFPANSLLHHATVVSPFPAGTPQLPFRFHARNTFFSHYCDAFFFMYGTAKSVHARILDIAVSRQVPITADLFPQTAGRHSPQQVFLLKLCSRGAVPFSPAQQNTGLHSQSISPHSQSISPHSKPRPKSTRLHSKSTRLHLQNVPEKLKKTDSQAASSRGDEQLSGSVEQRPESERTADQHGPAVTAQQVSGRQHDLNSTADVSVSFSTDLHKTVAECLSEKPRTTCELARECNASQQHIQQVLVELSLQSLAEYRADGRWHADPPS